MYDNIIQSMKLIRKVIILLICTMYCLNGQDHSINFDGNNDYVRIPDHSQLDLTENYTLEAWIFPETFSWLAGIISKYQTNAANGYLLRMTNQAPYNGLGFDEVVTSTGLLSANQWYHVAAVNDEGERRLYINGVEQSLSGSPLNVTANNNSIRIGSDYGSRYFDGRIDEVRIWDMVREQDDIVSDMDTTLSGEENGLVTYFTFNEGSGDTLYDQTGNGHHGLLMGGPSWADGYTLSALMGDINFDELLNIYDAVMLVAIMLDHEQGTELQLSSCDTNQDGVIDIEDIVLLFEWILEIDVGSRMEISTGEYHISENMITILSDGDVAGFQITLSGQNIDIDLPLPAGWSYDRSGRQIVAYGMDGSSLPDDFSFIIEDSESIENIKLAGWRESSVDAKMVNVPNSFMLKTLPNPFNPGCNISFKVNRSGNIGVSLFDVRGKYVQSIKNGQFMIGEQQFYWEPKSLSSGVYFIRIQDEKNFQYSKILYLK